MNNELKKILHKAWKNPISLTEDEKITLKENYLTINQLLKICQNEISEGNGDNNIFVNEYFLINNHNTEDNVLNFSEIHIQNHMDIYGFYEEELKK